MPRFKQDQPKQIPNLKQSFNVMTSHLPNQLPNITSRLSETTSLGKWFYACCIKTDYLNKKLGLRMAFIEIQFVVTNC